MPEKLKPCPFCGSDLVELKEDDGLFMAVCQSCSASKDPSETRADAVLEWNSRPAEEEAEERNTELKRDIEDEQLKNKYLADALNDTKSILDGIRKQLQAV